jgi:hypothetical protein
MNRRALLWPCLAALPLLGVGAWSGPQPAADARASAQVQCCPPDCCLPDCCPECCLPGCCEAGPLATKGGPAAETNEQGKAQSYICPLTGEELPCARCCPLNQQTAEASAKSSCCPPCPFCP